MNKKIKEAQRGQTPFMLIVGERERDEGTVTVRQRGVQEQLTITFEDFLAWARRLRGERELELGSPGS